MIAATPLHVRLAVVALSPLAGRALAGLARRFDGAERVSRAWMEAGAFGVGVVSISFTTASSALTLALGVALLTLVAVDMAALRLPDLITLPLAAAGLALGGLAPASFPERLLGLAVGLGVMVAVDAIYVRWRGRHGLGLGDAKLFAAAGAWLGASALPAVLLLACGGGLAWVALRAIIHGRAALKAPIPFGPPLCCAFWIVWLLG